MSSERAVRKLAAILAADVVGYSRLIEVDEANTLAAMKDLRISVFDRLLAEHRGRIVKLMGEGRSSNSAQPLTLLPAQSQSKARLLPDRLAPTQKDVLSFGWASTSETSP